MLLELEFAEEPYFLPGKGFHYSNTNTVLAGLIIEELTSKSFDEVVEKQIFKTLGMKNSVMPSPADGSIPAPHSRGYLYGTNISTLDSMALSDSNQDLARSGRLLPNDVTEMNPSWAWTAGAGISTASDLAIFVEALVAGGLLSKELQAQRMESIKTIDPANPDSASYGLALAKFGGLIGHDGSLPRLSIVYGARSGAGFNRNRFNKLAGFSRWT